MSFSLVEVAGLGFRIDKDSDELNTEFMNRLGMSSRFLPARLAISKSLAIPALPDQIPKDVPRGKTIKGDTLFGSDNTFFVWLSLIIERSGVTELETSEFKSQVEAHWHRGIQLLDQRWEESDHDIANFLKRIVDEAGLPMVGSNKESKTKIKDLESNNLSAINVPIGEISEETETGNKIYWPLNGQGGSPHCAIMGGVGSGKTRSAVAMLKSIRKQSNVPLLAFDFKGDLGSDKSQGGYHIDEIFSAQVIEPPRMTIPLDVLALKSRDEYSIEEAALHFRDSFTRLKKGGVGNIQKSAIHDAANSALKMYETCSLENIRDELKKLYEERELKFDGSIATFDDICRFPLFDTKLSPSEFFQQSWIIKMPPNVSHDIRIIIVNLILNALNQHLISLEESTCNSDGSRNLRIICMVDEAHNILGTKLPALSNLIRMSRSKGGAIILISQSPDDFSGEDDEFLSEMGLVSAFSTNANPRNVVRILGKGANLSSLQTGQCYVKIRGDRHSKVINSWKK